MPTTKKELHFFDREADDTDYNAYHANFKPKPQQRVIGEASPIYMYWNPAPYRIWSYNPAMKWILILRNPAERAYSAWNCSLAIAYLEADRRLGRPELRTHAATLLERLFVERLAA